jgi:hypothetical protein
LIIAPRLFTERLANGTLRPHPQKHRAMLSNTKRPRCFSQRGWQFPCRCARTIRRPPVLWSSGGGGTIPSYTDPIKAQILELVAALGIDRADDGGRYAELRQIRGRLLRRPYEGDVEVAAAGRADWVGWVEFMGA